MSNHVKVEVGEKVLVIDGTKYRLGTVSEIYTGSQGEKLVKVAFGTTRLRGKITDIVPVQRCYKQCK